MKKFLSLIMTIFLVVISMLGIVGCNAKYQKGTFHYVWGHRSSINMGVRSETDIFSINDVSLELHYGFYDLDDYKKEDFDPKSDYYTDTDCNTVTFAIYVSDCWSGYGINYSDVADFTNIENHYFIKAITEEEAFPYDYGYTMKLFSGTNYKHNEILTIPKEIFDMPKGSVYIGIFAFIESFHEQYKCIVNTGESIYINYETNGETVKLYF